jgi:outer membrane protein TolC
MKDAVQIALENNIAIKQKQELLLHSEAINSASAGAFLPKIGVTGGYTWFNTNPMVNMEMVKPALDDLFGKYGTVMAKELGLSDKSQEEIYNTIVGGLGELPAYDLEVLFNRFPNANIYALQPLFTGGKISNMKNIAEIENEVATIMLENTRDLIAELTISRYLKVLLDKKLLATRKNTLDVVQKHALHTKRMIETGLLPKHHSIQAEVAVSKAEAALEQEKNNLEISLIQLKDIMGCSKDSVFTLGDSLHYQKVEIYVDSLMAIADSAQPELQLADKHKEISERMYKSEVANLFPQVYAYANYSFFNDKMPVIMPPFTAGIQLNYTFFSGGSHYKMTKAAKHLNQEAAYSKENAKNKLYLMIVTTNAVVKNAETLYLKLGSTEKLAEENFRIANTRFKEGLGKSIEVLDSQTLLEDTRVERYTALYAYYQALAKLYLTAGQPEKILNLFNPTANN